MIKVSKNKNVNFKFVFLSDDDLYDLSSPDSPDVLITVLKGDYDGGAIIDGPFSYKSQNTNNNIGSITINEYKEVVFNYLVRSDLQEGVYSVLARTTDDFGVLESRSQFQVVGGATELSPVYYTSNKSAVVRYNATYEQLSPSNSNTILLIGHSDAIDLNTPVRIPSIESAINILGADISSPLLRGVLDAYAAGARDIVVCAAAPMIEYVPDHSYRNNLTNLYSYKEDVNEYKSFNQRYYERLEDTYSAIIDLDFVDIVVPLNASIIGTGSYDFVTQLATYCHSFHINTGFTQIGVIGSYYGGISHSDVDTFSANSIFTNKLTTYNSGGNISSDIGRYVIPVYGECVFKHPQITTSYINELSPAVAGLLSSTPLGSSIAKKRVPGAVVIHGSNLSTDEIQTLENLGVNTVYKGKKPSNSNPYECFISSDFTLANNYSSLNHATQMRLVAYVANQVKSYGYEAIGKFGYDDTVLKVRKFLNTLVQNGALNDFSFNVRTVDNQRGNIIFDIQLLSSLALKKLNFSIASGPGV